MKKVNFSTTLVGLGALALSLNFIYASNDYGISDNSLSVQVLAQTNKSGGDSGGSGESGTSTSTGTGTDKNGVQTKIDSNETIESKTCDHVYHTKTVQPGVRTICTGTGSIECENKFTPTGSSTTTITGSCPGSSCDIRN